MIDALLGFAVGCSLAATWLVSRQRKSEPPSVIHVHFHNYDLSELDEAEIINALADQADQPRIIH